MKQLNLFLTFLVLTVGILLWGCTEDIPLPVNEQEELYDGILLRIPDAQGLSKTVTRSQSNAEKIDLIDGEGLITSLHFYAFKSGSNEVVHTEILSDNNIETVTLPTHEDGVQYTNYDITGLFQNSNGVINEGAWRIYVVANLEGYRPDGKMPEITSEEELQQLDLVFFRDKEGEDNSEYLLGASNRAAYGLPAVCLAEDISFQGETNGSTSNETTGVVNLTKNVKGTIHADLSFLCSKVRYTVFFDNLSGTAKDIFKDLTFDISEVNAEKVLANGTTIGEDVSLKPEFLPSAYNCGNLTFEEYAYPNNADDYPEAGEENVSLADLDEIDPNQRAWQGTVYLPENGVANSPTTLSFLAHAVNVSDGREGSTLKYNIPLLPEERDGSKALQRGTAYDIVARVTKTDNLELLRLEAYRWDHLVLEYALTPPAFLHVEKTSVAVQAGHKSEINYESNAPVSFDSPKYGTENLYTFTVTGNTIAVGINSRIPTSAFNDIMKEENIDKYNFFHILAGNIRKRIDVSPLLLQKFLTVTPQNYSIDVRERMASGDYTGELYVTIETNIEKFRIDDISWLNASPATGNNLKIYIEGENGWEQLEFNKEYTPIDGQRRLRIDYNNINSGDLFWAKRQELSFTVSVDNGNTPPGPGYITPKTVKTNIVAANDNYVIHFRDNEGWDNPHIYVYQCLEMPAYWNKTAGGYNMASMPVGYEDRSGNPWKVMAALEYSFTGAIAFKGWETYSNNISLNDYGSGWYNEGFWVFSDGHYTNDYGCSWNPDHSESDARYDKGSAVDFCKEYRPTAPCADCRKGTGNPSWPGIRMMNKDADGWWSFELTGIATPGKALIMFTNGHSNYDGIKRYPGDLKVGIPLFDYPSHEGWFDLGKNNNTFVSSKPGGETVSYRRIYFDNSLTNYTQPYIYFYESGGSDVNADWPGEAMDKDYETGYWYYDIPSTANYTHVIFNPGGDDGKTADLELDKNQNLYNKNGKAGNVGEGGNGEDEEQGQKYRLIFPRYWNNNRQHLWLKFSDGTEICSDKDGTDWPDKNDYQYVEFTVKGRESDELQFKMSYYDGFDNLGVTLSGFGEDAGVDYKFYRIWDDWRGPYLPD